MTADDLLDRLRRALSRHGDFPASAKVVNELRALTIDPKTTSNQVTEVILREPSLGTRVLHLVNSAFYRRTKPIMTVSQAVVQIGMRPLAELCSGLILLQKFIPAARRDGAFAGALQKTIVTSLMTSSIASQLPGLQSRQRDETGYLTGSFSELGTLLLAYYFPKIYQSAIERSKAKNTSVAEGIHAITGLTPLQISCEVTHALNLPPYYTEVMSAADGISGGKRPQEGEQTGEMAKALFAGRQISEVVVAQAGKAELDRVLGQLNKTLHIEISALSQSLGKLPMLFKDHCSAIEVMLPEIPGFVSDYSPENLPAEAAAETTAPDFTGETDKFKAFVDEIRQAVESREPTASVITSVMETLAWNLGFDRVMLLLLDPKRRILSGRMLLGDIPGVNPRDFKRPIGPDAKRHAPDMAAVTLGRPIFNGEPMFADGWPIAAVPIGFGRHCIGVIYADRLNSQADEVDPRQQAAIGLLADLLDRSIRTNSEREKMV